MEYGTIEELLKGLAPTVKSSKRSIRENNWDKFYTLYAFDEIKYHKLCEKYPKANRYKLRGECYVLENGQKQPLGDEKNILRYKRLNDIKSKLAHFVEHNKTFTQEDSISIEYEFFTLYIEKYKAEPYTWRGKTFKGQCFTISEVELNGMWQMSLKERYLRHWLALKYLEQGQSINKACEMAKNANLKGM